MRQYEFLSVPIDVDAQGLTPESGEKLWQLSADGWEIKTSLSVGSGMVLLCQRDIGTLDVNICDVSYSEALDVRVSGVDNATPLEVVVAGVTTDESINVTVAGVNTGAGTLDVHVDTVASDCAIDVYIAGMHDNAGFLNVLVAGDQ